MRNLKLAARMLLRTPLVTTIAVLSLALGIGANAAMFSLFDQILLTPLPVPVPEQLINLGAPGPKPGMQNCQQAGDCDVVFSYAMFRDLERTQTVLSGVAAHTTFGASLAVKNEPTVGRGVLGIAAALGLGKAARSLLYGLEGHDLMVFSLSVILLALVALAAGFVPARRASQVDPMQALRYD